MIRNELTQVVLHGRDLQQLYINFMYRANEQCASSQRCAADIHFFNALLGAKKNSQVHSKKI